MTHMSLFSGIGGIDLAAEWAGFTTAGQCEIDNYATKVLEKNFPEVERWRDIHDVTVESFRQRTGISAGELTLLSGGFPCQPHSVAGKRKASADERDLWGEFARVIREIRPKWVLGENVRGLLSSENGRFFGRVLRDLDEMGYNVGWCCYGASDVGAIHKRERVFIIAHADGERELQQERREQKFGGRLSNGDKATLADPNGSGQQECRQKWKSSEQFAQMCRWTVEPNVGRMANGIPRKLDGGRLNEQSSGKKSGTESSANDGMRNMLFSEEFEPPSFELRGIHQRDGIMCGMSFETSSSKPKRKPGNSKVHDMREILLSDSFQKRTQDLQSGMQKILRESLRDEAMAWWKMESDIPRITKSGKHRVSRLKCLGNAVVPAQVYPILEAIAEIEKNGVRR